MAVASAYFLALNGLAAYLVLELGRTRERLRDLETRLEQLGPQLREVSNVAGLLLDATSEGLMKQASPSKE